MKIDNKKINKKSNKIINELTAADPTINAKGKIDIRIIAINSI